MNNTKEIISIASSANLASKKIAGIPSLIKDECLHNFIRTLNEHKNILFEENKKDIAAAEILLNENKLGKTFFNRLILTEDKFGAIISGIEDVIKMPDPVNKTLWGSELDDGLELYKVTVPIGVIAVIFESRPDVIPQIGSLAVKSSNAVILKGGSEAFNTNKYLYELFNSVLLDAGYPENTLSLAESREEINILLELDELIDLVIPRGSNSLVKYIKANTSIPVLGHSDGICHIYVDKYFSPKKAAEIIIDSKCTYPSACNAVETILLHKDLADNFLPELINKLRENNVKICGCSGAIQKIAGINPVENNNWKKEYSDLTVSLKIVKSVYEAVEHINEFGSGHTDCIITDDKKTAEYFLGAVDSAGVYHNASTRFADGYRYGFGAEVGISTNKIHARGPVGLEGLLTYKYKLYGKGHITSDYSTNKKKFKHMPVITGKP